MLSMLVIESLQFKHQQLDLHFYCHLLELLKYSVGNLGKQNAFSLCNLLFVSSQTVGK